MSPPTPDPLAEAIARREAAEQAEYAGWWAVERAHKRRAKPTEVAALEDELNEAKQRLIAACDAETRAREGR